VFACCQRLAHPPSAPADLDERVRSIVDDALATIETHAIPWMRAAAARGLSLDGSCAR